jgi:ribose-phosphate pyrophosphokinase
MDEPATMPITNPIALISGDAHPQLADEIARLSGAERVPATVGAFADGETRVRIEADVEDRDVYILQPTSTPTNERLMSLALLADAARAAGAARITALMPYFGYARQDVLKNPGEARSAQVAARLLHGAGVDRGVVLELHSPALESAFEFPLVHLQADDVMLPVVREWALADLTVIAPDAGALKRAQRYAAALGAGLAVVTKARTGPDAVATLQVLGEVRGRACLILDDMASTGNTALGAAQVVVAAGAREVHALFIHAVMAPGALERICAGPFRHIAASDSVPGPADARLQRVSVAPLFVRALTRLARLQRQ